MLEILRERRRKFPADAAELRLGVQERSSNWASLGPTGKIIESVGLKGTCVGDAVVSERHANFIVNRANARAEEVLALIDLVRERVLGGPVWLSNVKAQFVESTGVIRAP